MKMLAYLRMWGNEGLTRRRKRCLLLCGISSPAAVRNIRDQA